MVSQNKHNKYQANQKGGKHMWYWRYKPKFSLWTPDNANYACMGFINIIQSDF